MDIQEIDRRLAIFAEELEVLRHAQELLTRGFPFDADEIEARISRDEKKVSMLREMRSKACIREAEKAELLTMLKETAAELDAIMDQKGHTAQTRAIRDRAYVLVAKAKAAP